MPYYQTLRHRREDLNLSIQDVADQTRLKPEFIRAIEEHNLDLFSDDFSYVRYFVRAYCDAIGVNWDMIRDEVDQDVSVFANARDQALYSAQVRMIEQMPSVKSDKASTRRTRRRRKKSFLENSAGRISRKLSWGKSGSLGKVIVIGGACFFGVLLLFSLLQNMAAQKALSENQKQRQAELAAREQETRDLAKDLQSRKSDDSQDQATPPQLVITSLEEENTYTVSGFTTDHPNVHISFYALGGQTVTITWNGVPAFSEPVSGAGSYDLQAGGSGTLVVTFSSPSVYNALSIEESEIPANYTLYSPSGGCRIVLNLEFTEKKEEPASSENGDPAQAEPAEPPVEDIQPTDEEYTAPIEIPAGQ